MLDIHILDIIKIALAVFAAAFTYYRFFSEGTHRQRIEFDVDLVDLGKKDDDRILEIGVLIENKGYIEHKFKKIAVTVRGISSETSLSLLEGHAPRLKFPTKVCSIQLIPESDYRFVRPKITQRFSVVIKCSSKITHILVRADFTYQRSGQFHISERAFQLPLEN